MCYIVSSCSAALLSSNCVRDNTGWQEEIVAFRGTGVKDWIYNMYSQIGVHWKGFELERMRNTKTRIGKIGRRSQRDFRGERQWEEGREHLNWSLYVQDGLVEG